MHRLTIQPAEILSLATLLKTSRKLWSLICKTFSLWVAAVILKSREMYCSKQAQCVILDSWWLGHWGWFCSFVTGGEGQTVVLQPCHLPWSGLHGSGWARVLGRGFSRCMCWEQANARAVGEIDATLEGCKWVWLTKHGWEMPDRTGMDCPITIRGRVLGT